jgi:glycosyltransferase involved in cell wall biosynthesis
MLRPLVSVIIPCYNSEQFIKEALDSVLGQTWKNIEVIVVDDGSNDGTAQVLKQYEKLGVICLTQPNKGACAARNLGYRQSTGDFIHFLDADDSISLDKIEKQLTQLMSHVGNNKKLVHCKWGRFFNNKEVYYWGPEEILRKDLKPIDWLVANHMSMTGCWLVHRNLIEKAGLWDESLKRNQDGEFFSRLMIHAEEVLYCGEAEVYYRSGNKLSISSSKSRYAMESWFKSLELIEKYMKNLEISSRVNLSLANRFQDFIYSNYISNPDLTALAEKKVSDLGGAKLKLPGGVGLRFLARLFGWKKALTLKKILFQSA